MTMTWISISVSSTNLKLSWIYPCFLIHEAKALNVNRTTETRAVYAAIESFLPITYGLFIKPAFCR